MRLGEGGAVEGSLPMSLNLVHRKARRAAVFAGGCDFTMPRLSFGLGSLPAGVRS